MPESEHSNDQPKPGTAEPAAESGEPEEPAAEPEAIPEEADPLALLEAEAASLKDQLLRALAETENLRRRSQRERDDAVKYAAAPLIRDIIEVADNLRRALEAVPAEAVEADEHLKTLMTGVELTEKALLSVFERHHIVKIDPLGERLDPHFHEAIFEVPDPSRPAGTVAQVVRAGYRLHDRLLRAAQVGVAKGGPNAQAAPEPAGAAEAEAETPPAAEGEAEAEAGERRAPGSRIDTTA